MDEECADLGRIGGGIEQAVFAGVPAIASVERLALAPAAARDDLVVLGKRLHDKVGAVGDELAVDSIDGSECVLNLRWGIVLGLQATNRRFNEHTQDRNIGFGGLAQRELHGKEALSHTW
jgi:hypothetical protein